jgi:uncharacterized membrane protein
LKRAAALEDEGDDDVQEEKMAREVLQQKKRKAAPMSQEEREARQSKMRWIFLALVIMFLLAVYLVFELVIANRDT